MVLVMTHPHPWRQARADTALVIEWSERMPVDLLAVSAGNVVWMNTRQGQAERRVTITHELVHRERGDRCGEVSDADEEQVRRLTARRLISMALLVEAARWSTDEFEIAEHCWVDVDTVRTRLAHLHPSEVHHLRRATEHHREDERA